MGKENMKFGMQVVMTAQADKGDELASIMLKASTLVADMPGCVIYIVQQSLADDTKVLITEVWDNKDAHQASLSNLLVRELIMQAKPLIVGMEHHAALPLGGKGL
jgi:quinol monooxygenase YgiN